MRDNPSRSTVGDYVTLRRGTTYQGSLVGQPGPALLGLGSIQAGGGFRHDHYKTYGGDCPPDLMLRPGDLYVSLKGATKDGDMIGSVARVPREVPAGRLTQDTVALDFRRASQAEAAFVYWILRTPDYRTYCAGRATGSAVVGLSRQDFLSYPVPPLTDGRQRIVNLLEALEAKLHVNRRMNQTLEALAQALFRSWFVNYDPVRAKLDGRQPEGIDAETAALFPHRLVESTLGEIPAGWEVRRWGELVTLEYGKALRQYNEGSVPVFGTNGRIGFHNAPLCGHEGVVVGRKGAYRGIQYSPEPFFVIDTAFYVEPIAPLEMRWVYYELLREGVNSMDSGSAIPSTSRSDFYARQAVVPPPAIQRRLVVVLSPLWHRQQANDRANLTLAQLRDTLLPRLLSGDVQLRDVEAKIAATA
jgi:hypothetical protein